MNTNKISVKSVIKDFVDFSGNKGEINEKLIKKLAHDHLDFLNVPSQLKEYVMLVDVEDYSFQKPKGFKHVIQAAYRTAEKDYMTRGQVKEFTSEIYGEGCDLNIEVECDKCGQNHCSCAEPFIEVDVDELFLKAHPEYAVAHQNHFYNYERMGKKSGYCNDFKLMSVAQGSFWNSQNYINDCVNINVDNKVSYRVEDNKITVNFQRGQVLLAYMGEHLEDGYRMIPDTSAAIKSTQYAIQEGLAFRDYRRTKTPQDRRFWQEMIQLSEKWTARAQSELEIPDEDEFLEFIRNHWTKMIPYSDWWYNLNRSKEDEFQYPGETRNFKGYNL